MQDRPLDHTLTGQDLGLPALPPDSEDQAKILLSRLEAAGISLADLERVVDQGDLQRLVAYKRKKVGEVLGPQDALEEDLRERIARGECVEFDPVDLSTALSARFSVKAAPEKADSATDAERELQEAFDEICQNVLFFRDNDLSWPYRLVDGLKKLGEKGRLRDILVRRYGLKACSYPYDLKKIIGLSYEPDSLFRLDLLNPNHCLDISGTSGILLTHDERLLLVRKDGDQLVIDCDIKSFDQEL